MTHDHYTQEQATPVDGGDWLEELAGLEGRQHLEGEEMRTLRLLRQRKRLLDRDRDMKARLLDFALEMDFCTWPERAFAHKAMLAAWEWAKATEPEGIY